MEIGGLIIFLAFLIFAAHFFDWIFSITMRHIVVKFLFLGCDKLSFWVVFNLVYMCCGVFGGIFLGKRTQCLDIVSGHSGG